ncbi:ribonuclease H-like domain-containing protein [Candidatus Woesearchaeota archaeon]|nr:ribonuclease H-like domain-containing protein [Candidatus Woesearchaeota archaeon]
MIRSSFIFLEKIDSAKERIIWKQGISYWNDFLDVKGIKGIAKKKKEYYNRKIQEAQEALRGDDVGYFMGKLPVREVWRLYEYFKDECGFLDIEVDSYGKIILVGISNYYETKQFVKGVNLEKIFLDKELMKYKLIITFNGNSFDLPKLKKQLGVQLRSLHIDLKPLCVKLGLTGGLKKIEVKLELKRPVHLYGNPVKLWKAFHASGDREYLELLLAYNKEDVENLRAIMNYCYRELRQQTFINRGRE